MEILAISGLLIILLLLIYLSGWFSGTETAISITSPSHIATMKEENPKNIKYLIYLRKNMDRTIVAILIGNNLVNILLSSISAIVANSLFHLWGVSVMIGVITFIIIVFGEITPKSNAVMHHKRISLKNAKKVYFLTKAIGPLITVFVMISEQVIKISGGTVKKRSLLVSDDSIKNLATLGEEEGVIKKIEKDIIHNVFEFGDLKIIDIMMPFSKVFAIDKGITVKEAKKLIKKHGFTRVPVIDENKGAIGVIYSKDLLTIDNGNVVPAMRKPFFVSDKQDITSAFILMNKRKVHMAIVNDEKGNNIGLVTLEDIIEELVGDIHDEYYEKQKDFFSDTS